MSSPNEPCPKSTVRRFFATPRSLRTELLLAELAILFVVVLGFGSAIYLLTRQSIYREAEADLLGAAQLVAQDLSDTTAGGEIGVDRMYRHRFGAAPRDHAYVAVWNARGEKLGGSDPLPPHVVPFDKPPPTEGPRPFATRAHGDDLEVVVRGPHGEQVLVGRPLAKEHDRLRRLLVVVGSVGLVTLLLGGAAAWWLARRIVRPLEMLTATVEQVSEKQLDRRPAFPPASLELTRLAVVFDGMLARLQAAFERQTRFTADASHELRTPVSVILTQTEHSLARPRSAEEYAAALATCGRAARRMKRLVDDLLLLARADSGRPALRLEPCDLAEIARGAIELLEPAAAEHEIRIATHLQSTPLLGDAAQLAQVVTNLVANAIRYNRPRGEVSVGVHPRGEQVVLSVADQGIGIAADARARIFERFYRADEARTFDDGHGVGLGLSIVGEIVALHGGAIDFVSTSGQGTTFTVELPTRAVAASAPPVRDL